MSILFMHMNSPQVFSVCFCVCVWFFFFKFSQDLMKKKILMLIHVIFYKISPNKRSSL